MNSIDNLQNALSITYKNASDKDKLAVVYGAILQNIASEGLYSDLINRNYVGTPIKGGSVNVKRMKFATVNTYGTAKAANSGVKVQNNGVNVLINVDKEIVEEIEKKDLDLYGPVGLLAARARDIATSMMIQLDDAYFVALQTAATTFDTSPYSTIQTKVLALIRKLEAVTGDNVNKVDRSLMVLTLSPEHYDELETYCQTLPNPLNGGVDAKFFHRAEVRPAPRQDVDAVIQVRGSMAMPIVMDTYEAGKAPYSNAYVQELYYSYGIAAVMPELVFKAALSADNNISI